MSCTIYLPSKIVKEKYLRPAGLPDELLNDIPVDFWGGEKNHLPMYGKDVVEKYMDDHRPENPIKKSLKKEDFNMVDFGSVDQPLERIASCLEKLATVLVPRDPQPEGIRMLTPAEAAKQMRLNVQTVREWCRDGKMGIRTGSKWLISPDEVKQYLRGQMLVRGRAS